MVTCLQPILTSGLRGDNVKYYKVIENRYIKAVGTGSIGEEITETEYRTIINTIKRKPTAPSGYSYRLTVDLEWELYKLPVGEETEDPELSDSEALEIIVNGGAA